MPVLRCRPALRAQLRAGGWVDGIWRRPAGDVENLLNLPLALDSWAQFDALYAWDTRPLRAGGDDMNDQRDAIGTGACYLGAAVRSFFARGGRRAVIVRVGDPWPMIENAAARTAARDNRAGAAAAHRCLRAARPVDVARLPASLRPA